MAYKEHPEFQTPVSPQAKIWRYMDMAKLLSLLEKSALFFVRVDKLASVDPFEGYYTTANIQADNIRFEDLPQAWRDRTNIKDAQTFKIIIDNNKRMREFVKTERENNRGQVLQSSNYSAIKSSWQDLLAHISHFLKHFLTIFFRSLSLVSGPDATRP